MIRILLFLLILLFPLFACAKNELSQAERSDAYDKAQILGKCAGFFQFLGILFEYQGEKFQAEDAHQKSNGWRIATMGALHEAGWKNENITRTSDSIYEGALTKWLSILESDPESISDHIDKEIKVCLDHNESQEKFRKQFKMIMNQ